MLLKLLSTAPSLLGFLNCKLMLIILLTVGMFHAASLPTFNIRGEKFWINGALLHEGCDRNFSSGKKLIGEERILLCSFLADNSTLYVAFWLTILYHTIKYGTLYEQLRRLIVEFPSSQLTSKYYFQPKHGCF